MKFNFKIQQYQTDAVNAIVKVFKGQPHIDETKYTKDLGKVVGKNVQHTMSEIPEDVAFRNSEIFLTDEQLLKNIQSIQSNSNLHISNALNKKDGLKLDIEMETGTGKTYVYIKTIFELNRAYGFSKFIIVVPSIAIREGVKKSFEITQEHFMQDENYKKKVRFFVYNSKSLQQLDTFSNDSGIHVMIINMQAFSSSLKEDGRSKVSRIIYSKRDEFATRRPIDVIRENHPIVILDEPQKMGGEVTQKSIKNFKPLFILNYSATHKEKNHMLYVLDALEAYNQRLVKKIEVKGFQLKNLRGVDGYLYLENFVLSAKELPKVRLEFEIAHKTHITRKQRICSVNDDLYHLSNQMEQYKGFIVAEINPINGTVTFSNSQTITKGDIINDNEQQKIRRVQIRETIISHFEKEEYLFNKGIKTLSLFFIDEVAKYRQYDADNTQLLGEYGKIFEEEYIYVLNEYITLLDTPYQKYLREKCANVSQIHKGYFSIDRTGKSINSPLENKKSDVSDDISAYELILKNKERLLSFDEPTRFIFSHSALREGWDNPNIFQICTLKHSDNQMGKRQEVGRGLRLCVDQSGNRIDSESCGELIHDINKLTVIASESYADFVTDLQKDIKENLYQRPTKASLEYFIGKRVRITKADTSDTSNTGPMPDKYITISKQQANLIHRYLIKNDYIDDADIVTENYKNDVANSTLQTLPNELMPMSEAVHTLIQAIFDESKIKDMFEDGNQPKIKNMLNDNFSKKEFQELWEQINHKYAYIVSFDSNELIKKSVRAIDNELFVAELKYELSIGIQKQSMNEYEIERSESFEISEIGTHKLNIGAESNIKYDLIGKIVKETQLTRKTVTSILTSIKPEKFLMFQVNPEEFISKVIKFIKEQKATMIVEHISYNKLNEIYETSIFASENSLQNKDKVLSVKKHIQDYVQVDGISKESTEKKFVDRLETAKEVCVYAKLPRGFHIPTPVGNYSPDWAIAFNEGTVKHIFFIAETKGSMNSLDIRPIEQAKISCAKKLFNELSTSKVRYHEVNNFNTLLDIMASIK